MKQWLTCATLLMGLVAPCMAQEMSCKALLRECGDGPYESRNQNGLLSSVGGGIPSNQCTNLIGAVLASYQYCHGKLTYGSAATIVIHFAHENPDLAKQTGWECARAAFAKVFACQRD